MRKRCVVSGGIMITLAALSIVVFASSLTGMSADEISEQKTAFGTATAIGPETIKPRQSVTEGVSTEKPYQEPIASMDFDAEESYLLTKIAMAEAEGEDTEGKALVILVVINRRNNEDFPNSIEEVIYEEGQFSPVSNGRFDEVEPDSDCFEALSMVEKGWDESQGATFFESKSKSTWHRKHLRFLFKHGKHMFYVAPQ